MLAINFGRSLRVVDTISARELRKKSSFSLDSLSTRLTNLWLHAVISQGGCTSKRSARHSTAFPFNTVCPCSMIFSIFRTRPFSSATDFFVRGEACLSATTSMVMNG